MLHRRVVALFCLSLAFSLALVAQGRKKGEDPNIRMVQGTVTDAQGKAVEGAVVQIKNTKNLQIRSFITKEQGTYYFHNLDANIDYELRAEHQNQSSGTKTLSAFDNRKQPVINLRLETKK